MRKVKHLSCINFQLKPVRSLDSLRPAWSGHLRHGPPPSIVITNPCEVSSTKPTSSFFCPTPSDNSIKRSNMTPDTSASAKTFPFNSLTTKADKTLKEVHKISSLLPVSLTQYNQAVDPNGFLHEIPIHNNLMETVVNSQSCLHERESGKSEESVSSRDEKINSKDILTNADATASIWDSEPFDKTFKTSNFLHEVNENDPFDTSRVFTPTYLQTPLFKSTIPSIPVQFHHPLPHPFNTTSCSAHAKVNIIVHYIFYVYETVGSNSQVIVTFVKF